MVTFIHWHGGDWIFGWPPNTLEYITYLYTLCATMRKREETDEWIVERKKTNYRLPPPFLLCPYVMNNNKTIDDAVEMKKYEYRWHHFPIKFNLSSLYFRIERRSDRVVSVYDRNCFFSPMGCHFLQGRRVSHIMNWDKRMMRDGGEWWGWMRDPYLLILLII